MPSATEQWLGFWGNLVGSALSALVAYIIFQLQLIREREARREEREAELERKRRAEAEAHEEAMLAIMQLVHCAAAAHRCVLAALQTTENSSPRARAEQTISRVFQQLEFAGSHFSLREITRHMPINSRLPYVIILAQINSMIGIHRFPAGIISPREILTNKLDALEGLAPFLEAFDRRVLDQFASDLAENRRVIIQ
jgi:hypothetical protein